MNLVKVIKDLEDMRKAGFIDCNIQCFLDQLKKVASDKVTVPKYIADWIEEAKRTGYSIVGAVNNAPKGKVEDWLILKNVDVFSEAWVNGYKVEKEKKYFVKLKGVSSTTKVIKHNLNDDTWYMGIDEEFYALTPCHTKEELEKAGFGWVFSCEGMEVTEVEEY